MIKFTTKKPKGYTMKKLFTLCLLLAGCVTTQNVRDGFFPLWTNRDFDEFIMEYGAPSSSFNLQNGSTVYKWSSGVVVLNKPVTTTRTVQDSGNGTKSYTSQTSGGDKELECTMEILVDRNNKIKSMKITKDTNGQWSISRCSEVLKY